MITIPTSYDTAREYTRLPGATVAITEGRMSVYLGAVVFVAEIPAAPWTAFPHGYLSRRSS